MLAYHGVDRDSKCLTPMVPGQSVPSPWPNPAQLTALRGPELRLKCPGWL